MLDAVLFDWGDTLMRWSWDDGLLDVGHSAGLAAIGREPLPELTARFREAYLPLLEAPGVLEEVEYPGLVRQVLGDVGIAISDGELNRFLDAEHAAWAPARFVAGTTHALLEALRDRGLELGLVSNAIDPPWLMHRDLEREGIAVGASRTARSSSGRSSCSAASIRSGRSSSATALRTTSRERARSA